MSEIINGPSEMNPSTINWSDLHAKAMDFETPTETPSVEAPKVENTNAPEPVPAQSVQEKVETSPDVVTPAEQKVLDLPDDHLVKVKIDGQEQVVPFKQYKDALQREAAFYKRTQDLANQRKEAENVLAQQFAELQRRAQMVQQYEEMVKAQQQHDPLRQLLQQQMAPKPKDPNEIATLGEVEQKVQEIQKQYEEALKAKDFQMQQTLQQTFQQLREQQIVEQDARVFSNALNDVMNSKDFDLVKEVNPFAEQILRFQTAQVEHADINGAVQYMKGLAKSWADQIKGKMTVQQQQAAVSAAKAKMEPATGSAPSPVSKPAGKQSIFGKDGKVDWKALRERSAALMDE